MAEGIEMVSGQPLTDEEREQVELWELGRIWGQVYGTPLWDTIVATLTSYVEDAKSRVAGTDPRDPNEVRAEQAILYASNRLRNVFVEDVERAIEASRKPPEVVKRGLRAIRPGPPESV
jgi:hypothetical protein